LLLLPELLELTAELELDLRLVCFFFTINFRVFATGLRGFALVLRASAFLRRFLVFGEVELYTSPELLPDELLDEDTLDPELLDEDPFDPELLLEFELLDENLLDPEFLLEFELLDEDPLDPELFFEEILDFELELYFCSLFWLDSELEPLLCSYQLLFPELLL
jgi:hypothetical protein